MFGVGFDLFSTLFPIFFTIIFVFIIGTMIAMLVRGAKEKGMTAVHAFDDQNELVRALRADAKPGDALLFKGSHGMHMEQVLARLLKTKEHMGE